MNTTLRQRALAGAAAAAVLATPISGCAAENTGRSSASPVTPSSEPASGGTVPTGPEGSRRIRLIVGDRVATATLEDTAAARGFAAMLPVTISMRDLLGREKPGRLPRPLDLDGARREFRYEVGEIAYWAPGNDIAIFYADDGQAIPQPGLVRLGTVDAGLDVIATAGSDFDMSIELPG
jgi:hypothetical protein